MGAVPGAGYWVPGDPGVRFKETPSSVGSTHHDLSNEARRGAVRRVVGLHGLPFCVASQTVMLPGFRRTHGVEVGPEIGGDGVVGEIGDHPRSLAVLDFPERIAAELAVVTLLVDAEAALPLDEDAVLDVGDHLVDGG